MERKDLFCARPFEHIDVGNKDRTWICCPSWLPVPVGEVPNRSFREDWNSLQAQSIRESIHDGSFRYCTEACPYLKSADKSWGPVRPRSAIQDPRILEIMASRRTRLEEGPRELNATYDRSCNLACPSCRSEVISFSGEERRRIEGIQDAVWAQLGPDLEKIIVTGSGDAFASSTFRRLLKELDPEKYPNLKEVHLHTNGLQWTRQVWESMPKVHGLVKSALISIDAATPETYAVNRKGGSYSRLLENLEFIAGLDIPTTAAFVTQENNFREMEAFATLHVDYFGFTVSFSQLDNWRFSEQEWERRAVHLPHHPRHAELLEILQSPKIRRPGVWLGSLSNLASATPKFSPPPKSDTMASRGADS